MTFDQLVAKARKTNERRDAMDLSRGLGTPHSGDVRMGVRTAMSAIQCGITEFLAGCPDDRWLDAIAEGYVMLEIESKRLSAQVN